MWNFNKNNNQIKKEKIYYTLNYKSNIFLKDKGNIRVYEILSENKKINGIVVYQLESDKKYFLITTVGLTVYYDSVKDLLHSNKNNFPKDATRNIFIKKFLKSSNFFNQSLLKNKLYKFIFFIIFLITPIIYTGINSNYFQNYINSFRSENIPESPDKIFEKYKSSVVLIASEFYYEIATESIVCYYSPSTERKIFFSKEDVLNNLSFSTGTGFVISRNGEIITNNHVVNHKDENFKNELVNFFSEENSKIYSKIKMYGDSINQVNYTLDQFSNQLDLFDKEELLTKNSEYINKRNLLIDIYNSIDNLNFNNSVSKLIIHRLGVAYNNTHVSDFNDLQECVVVKTSENEKIDLALIQTKNKTFNTKPNLIFNFEDNNPNTIENPEKYKKRNIKNPIKINEDVFMIGFNQGFSLANTKQGIKSQFTSGKISQENDGERILYTIPTLEGSSGSPIVDKWGNLVGVNFAKIRNSQSFSFGVPVYEVKKFYEK